MRNLVLINKNVESINQTLKGLAVDFNELNIKEYDLVEVNDERGRAYKGFFKDLTFNISRWSGSLYYGIHLYRIKKDGTPSKVLSYVSDPINIKRV